MGVCAQTRGGGAGFGNRGAYSPRQTVSVLDLVDDPGGAVVRVMLGEWSKLDRSLVLP